MIDKKVAIYNAGRELFYKNGFKDTNVSDIMKSAGLAVGTFYNCYSTKEQLFYEIYIEENRKSKEKVIAALQLDDDPLTAVMKIMQLITDEMNSNMILREWYNRDIFHELEKNYQDEDAGIDSLRAMVSKELLKKWRKKGQVREDIKDEYIIAFFDSLAVIDTHKGEVGIHLFPDVLQYLVEFIMKGLTDFKNQDTP